MPNVFNPEFLYAYPNWKSIMNKIKANLEAICDTDKKVSIRLVRWHSKFIAEIKDLCRIELVQISGVNLKNDTSTNNQFVDYGQKNLYTVLFSNVGSFDNSQKAFNRYNRVCKHAVRGIE